MVDYNQLPYPNFVFTDTHPSRLAAAGILFGLHPKPSSRARILEIGCGAGLNTLAHAAYLPHSDFVAIDLSSVQIEQAKLLLAKTNFKNVKFLKLGIEQLDDSQAPFDYIICHGVFSWVSKSIQHQILLSCQRLLADQGIAYISYNVLPGWHLQAVFRDLLQWNARNTSESAKEAKSILKLAKGLLPKKIRNYSDFQIEHLLQAEDSYLTHEYLSSENYAFYFTDFLELLEQHGLAYLAESDLGSMLPREFPPEVQQQLTHLAKGSQSALEQYCDFLRLRQFRKTLIVKDSCTINRNINWIALKELWIAARSSHIQPGYVSKGNLLGSDLSGIEAAFPYDFRISDLIKGLSNEQHFLEGLFQAVMLDDLEIRDNSLALAQRDSNNYKVSNLVKVLLESGDIVPNLRSESVRLSQNLRQAISDGRSLEENELAEAFRLGILGGV